MGEFIAIVGAIIIAFSMGSSETYSWRKHLGDETIWNITSCMLGLGAILIIAGSIIAMW